MALVEYGAIITDLRGSIGGVTFQHTNAGKIARLKPNKFKTQTEKARARHPFLMGTQTYWQNLTLDEQEEWNTYAGLHNKYDKFGNEKSLTGINWHASINYNFMLTGGAYQKTPPVYVLPTAVPNFTVELSSTAITINFSPAFAPANTAIKIWATIPLLSASMNFDRKLKYISVDITKNYASIDITADWETATGLDYSDIFSTGAFFIGVLIEPSEISSGVTSSPTRIIQTTTDRIFTFKTNKNGAFTPTILTSDASIGKWTIDGFVSQTTNSPNFALIGANVTGTLEIIDFSKVTKLDVSSQNMQDNLDIRLFTKITDFQANTNIKITSITNPINSETFTTYTVNNCNITGTLDLSSLTNLSGNLQLHTNPNLTGITNPISPKAITSYYAHTCDLTGTLDLSGLTGLGGNLRLYSNPNLTGITNPVSSQTFTIYFVAGCNLTGTLDLSGLTGLAGNIYLYSNPNLTGITNPVSSQTITKYHAYACDITGTLDLSGLTGLGGEFNVNGNSNLTDITNPISSKLFTLYNAQACDITGTLDLSGLTGLGGQFTVTSNPNLTGITNPVSSQTFVYYKAPACGLTGTLDLSGLTGLGGQLYIYSNSSLTSAIFPATNKAFSNIWIYSCAIGVLNWAPLAGAITNIDIKNNAFTSAKSDENIVDIDTNVNLTTTLNIAGTNGVLTDGAVTGFDGITAKDNLVAGGVAVTFN